MADGHLEKTDKSKKGMLAILRLLCIMKSPSPFKRLGDYRNFHCVTNLTINFNFSFR